MYNYVEECWRKDDSLRNASFELALCRYFTKCINVTAIITEVPRLLFLFGLEIGIMLTSFHICDVMLVLRENVYICMNRRI